MLGSIDGARSRFLAGSGQGGDAFKKFQENSEVGRFPLPREEIERDIDTSIPSIADSGADKGQTQTSPSAHPAGRSHHKSHSPIQLKFSTCAT